MPKRVLSDRTTIGNHKRPRFHSNALQDKKGVAADVPAHVARTRARTRKRKKRVVRRIKKPTHETLPKLLEQVLREGEGDPNLEKERLHELIEQCYAQVANTEDKEATESDGPTSDSLDTQNNENSGKCDIVQDAETKSKSKYIKVADVDEANSSDESTKTKVDTSNLAGVHYHDHSSIMEVGEGIVYTMRKREQHHRPDDNYLSHQKQISKRMRATLLDWMFEVGQEFVFKRETLHVAITYVDRYLSQVWDLAKNKLQLVGVGALWLAAKSKEILPPRAQDLTFATDGAYSVNELISIEREILEKLGWNLDPITCYSWVNWYMHELFSFRVNSDEAKQNTKFSSKSNIQRKLVHEQNREDDTHYPYSSPLDADTENTESDNRLRLCFSSRQNNPSAGSTERWTSIPSIPNRLMARVMEIVDTALLDIDSLCFLPSTIAAAALIHVLTQEGNFASIQAVERVTMYNELELFACRNWMDFTFSLPANTDSHPRAAYIRRHIPQGDWPAVQKHNSNSLPIFRNTAGLWEERHPACDSQAEFSQSELSPSVGGTHKKAISTLSAIPQTPNIDTSGTTNSVAATTTPSELEEENSLLCEEGGEECDLGANESL